MTSLTEDKIEQAFSDFCNTITQEFSEKGTDVTIGPSGFHLILEEDLLLTDKDDPRFSRSDGRYRFRKGDAWREAYIPHADSPGVYFFFDEGATALYVGKSEVPGGIGRRVWEHVGKLTEGGFPDLKFPEAAYVITIPFDKAPWLAAAFETYLLMRYTFKYNEQHNKEADTA